MKITGEEALNQQPLGAPLQQPPERLNLSWRQQWERAQWEWASQTRATPLGTEPARVPMDVVAVSATRTATPPPFAQGNGFAEARASTAARLAGMEPEQRALIELVARQTGAPVREIALVPMTSLSQRLGGGRVAPTAFASATVRQLLPDVTQTQTTVVVAVDGREIVVSLRDATLSQSEQQNLVKRLRAELHSRGFVLAGVWINGCRWDGETARQQAGFA